VTPSSGTFAAALDCLARGWSVIPVERGAKRPLVRWREYQQRCPTPSELRTWFTHWPEANLAVVTGIQSGLVVLDVDAAHGGVENLAALEDRHGELPATLEAITGGGGRHLYFGHPGGFVPNRVAIEPGLDLRGDGGYVVVPPSVHPSGRPYAWRAGHGPNEVQPAELPGLLLGLISGTGEARGHSLDYWCRLVREGVAEGARNNTIASLTGHLLWNGVDPDVVTELMLCWNAVRCRPPLDEEEVVRTVESILRTHQRSE
jgi:hypothetical protein